VAISVFDLFRIGIGPSSSHTVGPMRAAGMFARGLLESGHADRLARIQVGLFGSLGATGKGHGTDKALILGLEGELPESVDTDAIPARLDRVAQAKQLRLLGEKDLDFDRERDLLFHKNKRLPFHPNGMTFHAFDINGQSIRDRTYYSVGGGFVVNEEAAGEDRIVEDQTRLAFPFTTAVKLLEHCTEQGL
jgi:L-serine dehydratase